MVNDNIAVTGLAWTTALGTGLEDVWNRLIAGESGIREAQNSYNLRNNCLAKAQVDYENTTPSHYLQAITKETVERALIDSQINSATASKRVALIVGTSFGARLDDEEMALAPLHEWVDTLAAFYNMTPFVISTACSSASDAILTGASLIKAGLADICVCGGADILGNSKLLAHSALGTMSPTTLRSFDEQRDGTILGEGAGFMVLEKYTSAIANKNIYAFLSGCGSANDAAGLTAPDKDGKGIELAIERSLNDAGIDKLKIKLINAHGSGTITNDIVEATAYKKFFEHAPLIFATKGAFGHSLGATGALEAIALILALQKQTVPPIVGHTSPIDAQTLHFSKTRNELKQVDFGLSLTIGFGGFNSSLIFKRYHS